MRILGEGKQGHQITVIKQGKKKKEAAHPSVLKKSGCGGNGSLNPALKEGGRIRGFRGRRPLLGKEPVTWSAAFNTS